MEQGQKIKTSVNRQYKDSLFRMIFSEKEELLSLYNAVNGTKYSDANDLTINTIEDVIFLGYKNDLSLVLEQRLGIYEHQSTWCGNVPLRSLFYVGKNYAGITASDNLYSSKMIKLPNPQFVVFYNGNAERPERETVRLSDAYEHHEENPKLELEVLVLNINVGYNDDLMNKCKKLNEYSIFVSKAREYSQNKELTIEQAIHLAVEECIENDVLKEFLLKHREEVETVSIGEYNFQEHMKVVAKENMEEGISIGEERGIELQRIEGEKLLSLEREESHKRLEKEREENLKRIIAKFLKIGMSKEEIIEELKDGFDIEFIKRAMEDIS